PIVMRLYIVRVLSSKLVSTVGNDSTGKVAFDELKKYGVDTTYVSTDPKAKTRYSVILNYKADRTILSYSDKKNYEWPEPFPETEWIYYTGLSEGYEKLQSKLVSYLKKHPSVRLALNPGSFMLKHNVDDIKEMIERTDVLIVNVQEAERLLGTTIKKEKNVEALIHELVGMGVKEVAITDGGNGAWAGDANEAWHLDAYPVHVVAKTGAGDAFSAGYLAARQYGHDLQHALEWGIANSCSVVSEHGPHKGLLDKKEVMAVIQKFPTHQPQEL
ncbi:MAG TPA: carbohydrate kinase family protein, partial [Patescibacteria group bacterium]|nr:carbohydrate kinase family protein [Patescibacteria group bacterium]